MASLDDAPLPRIDYTGKDFTNIRDNLVQYIKENHSDVWTDFFTQDLGILLLNTMSYMGAMLAFYQDRDANEAYLPTALERQNVINIGKKLGYVLSPASAASGDIQAVLNQVYPTDVTIRGGTKITIGSTIYEVDRDFIIPANLNPPEGTILIVEGQSASKTFQPTQTTDRRYLADHDQVINGSVKLYVDGGSWQFVPDIYLTDPGDQVYSVLYNANDRAELVFGDGLVNGKFPASNSVVRMDYRVGGGKIGNRPAGVLDQTITGYDRFNREVSVRVTNDVPISGGDDRETIEQARRNIPRSVKTPTLIVSEQQYDSEINHFNDSRYGSVAIGKAFLRRITGTSRGGGSFDDFRGSSNEFLGSRRDTINPVNVIDVFIWSLSSDSAGRPLLVTPSSGLTESLQNYLNSKRVTNVEINVEGGYLQEIPITIRYKPFSAVQAAATEADLLERVYSFFDHKNGFIKPGDTFFPESLSAQLNRSDLAQYVFVDRPTASVTVDPNKVPHPSSIEIVRLR